MKNPWHSVVCPKCNAQVTKPCLDNDGLVHDERSNLIWRKLEADQPPASKAPQGWQREEFRAAFREAHATLHRLWTAAVGTETYDKAAWRTLDNALARFARDAAEKVGIGQSEPLLWPA